MKTKTSSILLLALITLTGCNRISGEMTVNAGQELKLVDARGRMFAVASGDAVVVMKDKKIVLKFDDSSGSRHRVVLKAPAGGLPEFETNGSAEFLATESGQAVDIKEITVNQITHSEQYDGFESCTIEQRFIVPCPPRPHGGPVGLCYASRYINGSRYVKYHYEGDHFSLSLGFYSPSTKAQLGTFSGFASDSERVIDAAGGCRIPGDYYYRTRAF